MNLFRDWQSPQPAHDLEVLEAHEDWLIHILDTLGNGLTYHDHPHLVSECLERVQRGLYQFIHHEVPALDFELDAEQRQAHHGMLRSLEELAERHARGEQIGSQLLERLQHWLSSHCHVLHHQTLQ